MRGRRPSEKSKYYLPPKQYVLAVSFALMRDEWAAEIKSLQNQSRGIRYDRERVQVSNDYNANIKKIGCLGRDNHIFLT